MGSVAYGAMLSARPAPNGACWTKRLKFSMSSLVDGVMVAMVSDCVGVKMRKMDKDKRMVDRYEWNEIECAGVGFELWLRL